jgi:hypothetical protein
MDDQASSLRKLVQDKTEYDFHSKAAARYFFSQSSLLVNRHHRVWIHKVEVHSLRSIG